MDNGRFNELFESIGQTKADIKNIKDDVGFLLKRVDELHTKMTKIYAVAAFAGGAVSLIVSVLVKLL